MNTGLEEMKTNQEKTARIKATHVLTARHGRTSDVLYAGPKVVTRR
jgi:hypothetical protein